MTQDHERIGRAVHDRAGHQIMAFSFDNTVNMPELGKRIFKRQRRRLSGHIGRSDHHRSARLLDQFEQWPGIRHPQSDRVFAVRILSGNRILQLDDDRQSAWHQGVDQSFCPLGHFSDLPDLSDAGNHHRDRLFLGPVFRLLQARQSIQIPEQHADPVDRIGRKCDDLFLLYRLDNVFHILPCVYFHRSHSFIFFSISKSCYNKQAKGAMYVFRYYRSHFDPAAGRGHIDRAHERRGRS